jgi:hypothetical protein
MYDFAVFKVQFKLRHLATWVQIDAGLDSASSLAKSTTRIGSLNHRVAHRGNLCTIAEESAASSSCTHEPVSISNRVTSACSCSSVSVVVGGSRPSFACAASKRAQSSARGERITS